MDEVLQGRKKGNNNRELTLTLLPDVQEEAKHHEEGKSCHTCFSSSLVIWREKSPSELYEQHFCKMRDGDKVTSFVAENARPFDYLISTTITFVHQPAPALVQCFSC